MKVVAPLISFISLAASQHQIVTYDTGASDYRLTCNPVPASCTTNIVLGSTFGCRSYRLDDEGFCRFIQIGNIYESKMGPTGSIERCDEECTCVTGFYNSSSDGIFTPDGGNCPVISTEDGTLTPPPAYPRDLINYDASVSGPDENITFTCPDFPTQMCTTIRGGHIYSKISVSNGTHVSTFANCSDDVCYVQCDPHCNCSMPTGAECMEVETSMPTESPAPSRAPSEPTESPSGGTRFSTTIMLTASMLVISSMLSV